jgi:hypothetical protein
VALIFSEFLRNGQSKAFSLAALAIVRNDFGAIAPASGLSFATVLRRDIAEIDDAGSRSAEPKEGWNHDFQNNKENRWNYSWSAAHDRLQ